MPHLARSAELIARQRHLIESIEDCGLNAQAAREVLRAMYVTRRLMIEHVDRLEACRQAPPVAPPDVLAPAVARHNGLPWPLGPKHLVVDSRADRHAA